MIVDDRQRADTALGEDGDGFGNSCRGAACDDIGLPPVQEASDRHGGSPACRCLVHEV
jgi:hypothetical protein